MGTDGLLNLLCWTPLAKPIRALRQHKINRIAKENYDKRKIDSIIENIVTNYGDLLS